MLLSSYQLSTLYFTCKRKANNCIYVHFAMFLFPFIYGLFFSVFLFSLSRNSSHDFFRVLWNQRFFSKAFYNIADNEIFCWAVVFRLIWERKNRKKWSQVPPKRSDEWHKNLGNCTSKKSHEKKRINSFYFCSLFIHFPWTNTNVNKKKLREKAFSRFFFENKIIE